MGQPRAFWSYVHADNEAESGRIVQLAHDVVAQFELLTGDTIELVVDSDLLEWGDEWRVRLDEGLSSVAFFIAVLSPRYFRSAECRRELNHFARRAEELGIAELALPLLYVDVPELHSDDTDDELIALVKRFQWVDWRETRFGDRTSSAYRRAVSELAARLVKASQRSETIDVPAAATVSEAEDDSPGVLDLLVATEVALPALTETLTGVTEEINDIGELMRDGTSRMHEAEARGARLAGRLRVLRDVAQDLAPRADKIIVLGQAYTTQLYEVDLGMRAVIGRAPEGIEDGRESIEDVCAFFSQVRSMVEASHRGLAGIQGMVSSIEGIEGMSRDLRAPLRALKKGLTLFVEGESVISEWAQLMDSTGVDCSSRSGA